MSGLLRRLVPALLLLLGLTLSAAEAAAWLTGGRSLGGWLWRRFRPKPGR